MNFRVFILLSSLFTHPVASQAQDVELYGAECSAVLHHFESHSSFRNLSPWDENTASFQKVAGQIVDFEKFAVQHYGDRDVRATQSARAQLKVQTDLGKRDAFWEKQIEDAEVLNQEAIVLYQKFKELGTGFESLLVDPALVQRYERFKIFLKKHPEFKTPWQARSAFRKSTDDVIVYRAMVLTPDELIAVQKNGIESNHYRRSKEYNWKALAGLTGKSYWQRIYSHVKEVETKTSEFISVTAYPEIAVAVANRGNGGQTYLFEIKLKEADLLKFEKASPLWSGYEFFDGKDIVLRSGKSTRKVDGDSRIESFVYFNIPSDAIRSIPFEKNASMEVYRK